MLYTCPHPPKNGYMVQVKGQYTLVFEHYVMPVIVCMFRKRDLEQICPSSIFFNKTTCYIISIILCHGNGKQDFSSICGPAEKGPRMDPCLEIWPVLLLACFIGRCSFVQPCANKLYQFYHCQIILHAVFCKKSVFMRTSNILAEKTGLYLIKVLDCLLFRSFPLSFYNCTFKFKHPMKRKRSFGCENHTLSYCQ